MSPVSVPKRLPAVPFTSTSLLPGASCAAALMMAGSASAVCGTTACADCGTTASRLRHHCLPTAAPLPAPTAAPLPADCGTTACADCGTTACADCGTTACKMRNCCLQLPATAAQLLPPVSAPLTPGRGPCCSRGRCAPPLHDKGDAQDPPRGPLRLLPHLSQPPPQEALQVWCACSCFSSALPAACGRQLGRGVLPAPAWAAPLSQHAGDSMVAPDQQHLAACAHAGGSRPAPAWTVSWHQHMQQYLPAAALTAPSMSKAHGTGRRLHLRRQHMPACQMSGSGLLVVAKKCVGLCPSRIPCARKVEDFSFVQDTARGDAGAGRGLPFCLQGLCIS